MSVGGIVALILAANVGYVLGYLRGRSVGYRRGFGAGRQDWRWVTTTLRLESLEVQYPGQEQP